METAPAQSYRRRQYLVNRPLQYRFVGALLLFFLVLAVVVILGIYVALWGTLYSFELHQDPLTVALFRTVGWVVAVELLLLAPLVFLVGVFISHKVAGPLVRIHAVLAQMAEGRYDIRLTLRKGDALTELADDINRLAAALRQRGAPR